MIRPHPRLVAIPLAIPLAILLAAGSAGPLPAQEPEADRLTPIEQAADTLIEALIPRREDPAARITALIDAAERVRDSNFAVALLAQVDGELPAPVDPRVILERLERFERKGATGEVAHGVDTLRRSLLLDLGRFDAVEPSGVFQGYADRMAVIGPFGDAGDHYVGVPFPPEQGFPSPGTELRGRFGPVRSRLATRRWDRYRIDLPEPQNERAGCYYALHQVTAAQETPGYLRVFVLGSFEVFLNGTRVAAVDVVRDDRRPPRFVPVVLRPGHNQVLVKTCENRVTWIGLRYVDPDCRPMQGLTEFAGAPAVRPFAAAATSAAPPSAWPDPGAMLETTAAGYTGERRDRLLLAAAVATISPLESYRLIDRVLQAPPGSPRLQLALARLLASVRQLPATFRRQQARAIVEAIGDRLGDHAALAAWRIRLLEDEDKLEDAVRALRARIAGGGTSSSAAGSRAGAESFQQLAALYQRLGLWAAHRQLEERWMRTFPFDMRPVRSAIRSRTGAGDYAGALRLARQALERVPGERAMLHTVLSRAAGFGDAAAAEQALAALHPRMPADSLALLRDRATLRRRLGDEAGYLELTARIGEHPGATVADLRRTAEELLGHGRDAAARRICARLLEVDPSSVPTRRRLWRLDARPEFPNLAGFRVDTAPLIAGFSPTERERGAGSTLVLDHLIVEVFADGSSVQEVHTLRRINDQRGVSGNESASGAAAADEVVVLRTIGADGKSFLPNRVGGEFHLPRLEPGVFVEEVYRNYRPSDAPDPQRIARFFFRDQEVPYLRSELVLILPPGHRSKVRLRNFPGEPVARALPDGKTAWTWRVDDSPRLPAEQSPPPVADIVPVLAFGEDGDVAAEARRYRATVRHTCLATPPIRRQAEQLCRGLATDLEKAKAIHRFVHTAIERARGSSDPTAVLIDRKGPRFWLELALLSAAGVPHRDGLAAGRRKARRDEAEPLFAGETPYDVPCARVEPRGGAPLWLFAGVPRHFPLGAIPADRLGAEVLLVDPEGPRPEELRLPDGDVRDGLGLRVTGALALDGSGDGVLTVDLRIRGETGFGLAEMLADQPANRQQQFARNVVGRLIPGWSLGGAVELLGLAEGPLVLRATLRRRQILQPAGGEFLLPLPLPPSDMLAAFGDREGRTLPYRTTGENAMHWRITVDPGAAWQIVEPPDDHRCADLLLEYRLGFEKTGAGLTVTRDLLQRAGRIEAGDFDRWRSLLKAADEAEARNTRVRRRR